MALVAPGVEIHRSEEYSVGCMNHQALIGQALGNAEARSKIVSVGVHQSFWIAILAANENAGHTVVEDQVGVGIVLVVQRVCVFVANAEVQGGGWSDFPAVFHEGVTAPISQIHLRDSGLSLLHCRETEQETGESGAAAVI